MIVVDASLATKWFVNEPDSERARFFVHSRQGQLCGPELLAVEVSRALVAAANARRMEAHAARKAIAIWLESVESEAVPLHPLSIGLIRHGVKIALDLGHPLADCLYLALAIELDSDLATCDAKFQAKAAPIYPRVKLLAEFS